jgi:CheY-like chemotaxis protein
MAAHGFEENRRASLKAGMNDHITKLASKVELAKLLEKWGGTSQVNQVSR